MFCGTHTLYVYIDFNSAWVSKKHSDQRKGKIAKIVGKRREYISCKIHIQMKKCN